MSTLHERLLARIDHSDEHRLIASWNAVRAVVELHAPVERVLLRGLPAECNVTECTACLADGPAWPCSTIKAIASALGVETGETPK